MPRLTACFVALTLATLAFGQPIPKTELDKYRPYFLKQTDDEPKDGAVKVTFLGTTSLLVDDGETQLLFDGYFSRPSLIQVGLGKLETDKKAVDAALKQAKADRVTAIFAAHSHIDHAFDVAYLAHKTKAKVYGSPSTLNIARGGDVPEAQLVLYDPGKPQTIGQFTVTVFTSKHSVNPPPLPNDLGKTIDAPLRQPAKFDAYVEGGSFEFHIARSNKSIFLKPQGDVSEGPVAAKADVLFLSTPAFRGLDDAARKGMYDRTVGTAKPKRVIPVHWDNFFKPLSDNLIATTDACDAFDFLIPKLKADGIEFGILQGYQSVLLFAK
jgi:L-ascorbate metabolism protein UlaG (beta-lactamase superfamily)